MNSTTLLFDQGNMWAQAHLDCYLAVKYFTVSLFSFLVRKTWAQARCCHPLVRNIRDSFPDSFYSSSGVLKLWPACYMQPIEDIYPTFWMFLPLLLVLNSQIIEGPAERLYGMCTAQSLTPLFFSLSSSSQSQAGVLKLQPTDHYCSELFCKSRVRPSNSLGDSELAPV